MIRTLLVVIALLAGIVVWQRGSVSIAHRAADAAATARDRAQGERDTAFAELAQAQAVITTERANAAAANAVAA